MRSVRKAGRNEVKMARFNPEKTMELSLQRGSKCRCRKLSEEILYVADTTHATDFRNQF